MKRNIATKIFAVLIASILLFEAFPHYVKTKAYSSDSDRVIVSLGDSFSSGEGLGEYYNSYLNDDQNTPVYDEYAMIGGKVKHPDWLAHRSSISWPGRLTLDGVKGTMADNRNTHWFFAATSGATTTHLTQTQRKYYFKNVGTISGYKDLPAQLDIFDTMKDKEGNNLKADYVTITIGGNDAGFADIITKAVTTGQYFFPNSLKKQLEETTLKFIKSNDPYNNIFEPSNINFNTNGEIYKNLDKAYDNIAEKAGNQAHIIVAGYPRLITPDGGKFFNKNEAELINTAIVIFNRAIEKLVNEKNQQGMSIHFASGVLEKFGANGAYSDTPLINKIEFPQSDDLVDFILDSVAISKKITAATLIFNFIKLLTEEVGNSIEENNDWLVDDEILTALKRTKNFIGLTSSSSMHPNSNGAQIYANCVQDVIDNLEKQNNTDATTSTTQQSTDTSSNPFYNDQFYQQQQYNMQIGTWDMMCDIAYDDSAVYYNTNSNNTYQIKSADDIFYLKNNFGMIINTSTDSSKKEIYASGNCAVTDSHIYYTNNGQICRLSKTYNTNVSNNYQGTSTEEIIYQFDGETPTKYLLSEDYIYILDGCDLIKLDHNGNNKKVIATGLTNTADYYSAGIVQMRLFTINNNLYYINNNKLYCYNNTTDKLLPLFNVSNDIEISCASSNTLYFSKTELFATDVLDDQYTTTVFKYTEGDSDIEEYMSFVTYGAGSIFVDPLGAVYIAHTHGGGTEVSKFVNGTESSDSNIAFSMDCSLYVYKNQIIGFDFMGENIISAYTF